VIAFVEGMGTGMVDGVYAAFIRKDAQPPAQIGYAYHLALAPDARAAYVITGETTPIIRVSTDTAAKTPLAMGRIAHVDISDRIAVSWSGKDLVVRGAEAGKPMQLWRIPTGGGDPQPLGRDAPYEKHPISPDGSLVALANASGGVLLFSTSGGSERVIAGPEAEHPIGFSTDGTALFTYGVRDGQIEIYKLELASGERAVWDALRPELLTPYFEIAVDGAGQLSVYTIGSKSADMYVVSEK
jgi:WD40 repeat protein